MNEHRWLQSLDSWYQTPLGQKLALTESEQLARVLPSLYGYNLLQIGMAHHHAWLNSSAIHHRIFYAAGHYHDNEVNLMGHSDALPFPDKSMDVVFLPHVLEFSSEPLAVLKEVQRVLVSEGHLILLGFNPASLWGLAKYVISPITFAPGYGNFLDISLVRSQLKHLGFEISYLNTFFYRPPVSSAFWLKRLRFLETLGRLASPYPGGVYLMIAKIKELGMTRLPNVQHMRWIAPTPCPRGVEPVSSLHHNTEAYDGELLTHSR